MIIGVFTSGRHEEDVLTLNSAIWRARREELGIVYTLYQVDSFFIEFAYLATGLVIMNYYASLNDVNARLWPLRFNGPLAD